MNVDFIDLAGKAKELKVSESVLRGRILSGAIDCYVFLRERAEATQETFLPLWTFETHPHVRWRDLGAKVDPSGTYEHGTREILAGRRRVTPCPAYEITGWVRLSGEFIAEVFTSNSEVSLQDWHVAVDQWVGESYVPVRVTGDCTFIYEEGYVTTCQKVRVEDVMFLVGDGAPKQEERDNLDPRREKSLLRVIRALDVMAKLPKRGAATPVEKQLQELGFVGPNDETVRAILDEARELKPDNPQ
jgi:hypothetical protein